MSALCQKRASGYSLNYLLGALLKLQGHVEAERLGGLEIDYQIELDWGLDWKVGRFLSFEDAVDIGRRAPKIIGQVISVGQQAVGFSKDTVWVDGRETVASRQRCDLRPMFGREGIRHHDQAAIRLVRLCCNDGFELGCAVNRCDDRLHREGSRSGFEGVQPIFGIWRR